MSWSQRVRYRATTFNRVLQFACGLTFVALTFVPAVRAQSASIGGTVLIDPSEKPLANAEVLIAALNRTTRSDSAGNFVFTGLPAGKYALVVRLPGYEPSNLEITLTATQKFEADFLLKANTTTLAKVDVKGKAAVDNGMWTIKLAEFEERRSMGIGKFMTKDEFEKEDGRPVSSFLVSRIAGLRIVQINGQAFLASTRGGGAGFKKTTTPCYMQVVINGVVRWNGGGQQMFDLNTVNTKDIIGFEFYTTATTPLQYNATRGVDGGSCGTVVIWTKGGG